MLRLRTNEILAAKSPSLFAGLIILIRTTPHVGWRFDAANAEEKFSCSYLEMGRSPFSLPEPHCISVPSSSGLSITGNVSRLF